MNRQNSHKICQELKVWIQKKLRNFIPKSNCKKTPKDSLFQRESSAIEEWKQSIPPNKPGN